MWAAGTLRRFWGALLTDPHRLLAVFLTWLALAASARAETIRFEPEGARDWGIRNVFGPLRSLASGPGYWYGERKIEVDSSPPGATIDLFYVRANFQKKYQQTTAPVTVLLPSRMDAGPRDSVTIRAFLPGYRSKEVRVPVEGEQSKVTLDLDPLPNLLEGASQSYFGGRSSLTFLTRLAPVVRFQDRPEGFNVVLNETAEGPSVAASLAGLTSPIIQKIDTQQLGEDLLVRVELTPAAREQKPELRSREGFDTARDLHAYTIDMVPRGATGPSVERLQAALAGVRTSDVTGCAAEFDAALRAGLDPAALARALSPNDYREAFLRAAMKRLGEVSPGGVITLTDGTKFNAAAPIELAAASSQPHLAQGYLALLRRVTDELEAPAQRDASFRSLVAPEVSSEAFSVTLAQARTDEEVCVGTARSAR